MSKPNPPAKRVDIKPLLKFISDNFASFADFRDFYRSEVYPNERKLAREMKGER